jgi:hypothetical protein
VHFSNRGFCAKNLFNRFRHLVVYSLRTVFGTRLCLLFAIGSGLHCRGEKRDPVADLLTSSAFIGTNREALRPTQLDSSPDDLHSAHGQCRLGCRSAPLSRNAESTGPWRSGTNRRIHDSRGQMVGWNGRLVDTSAFPGTDSHERLGFITFCVYVLSLEEPQALSFSISI